MGRSLAMGYYPTVDWRLPPSFISARQVALKRQHPASRPRYTERAIISSSSVRMTRTVARLASVEIAPEVSALCDSFRI